MFGWQPGIGDPTVYGWLTVVAYLAAAWLCAQLARATMAPAGRGGPTMRTVRRERLFWTGMAVFLLLLGINKQLDLQSLFTAIGRTLAHDEGWYAERRAYQRLFVTGVAAGGAATGMVLLFLFRRAGPWVLAALVGAALLTTFVVIRAASFHHIDRILGSGIAGFRANHAMELGGIAIIAGAAWARGRGVAEQARWTQQRAVAVTSRRGRVNRD